MQQNILEMQLPNLMDEMPEHRADEVEEAEFVDLGGGLIQESEASNWLATKACNTVRVMPKVAQKVSCVPPKQPRKENAKGTLLFGVSPLRWMPKGAHTQPSPKKDPGDGVLARNR